MKPTPRDLASASILALLLASAASAQHATESLTSEVGDLTITIDYHYYYVVTYEVDAMHKGLMSAN